MKDKALKKILKSLISCLFMLLFIVLTISFTTGCKQQQLSKNLSYDQTTLVSVFGYPDQFLAVFAKDKSRAETWFYKDMQYAFSFIDGAYTGRQRFVLLEDIDDKYNINPGEFSYGMNPDDIVSIMGKKYAEMIEPDSGYRSLIYADGAAAFTFDTEDNLVCVLRQKAIIAKE